MKCVIWGIGIRGKRIASRIPDEMIAAFIDSNKCGEIYLGKKVIDFQEYLEHYSDYFILITPLKSQEIVQKLEDAGIYWYWDMRDCPSELQGVAEYPGFAEKIQSYNKGRRYGVYGTNFYSLYFYDLLYKSGCADLYLIPEENTDSGKVKKIVASCENVKMIPSSNWKNYIDEVYVTVDMRDTGKLTEQQNVPVENMFDFSHVFSEYKNEKIAQLKDRNAGERCFIVATGPSLKMEDLDTLNQQGEYSIGVNRIYLAFDKTDWRPDYYVVCDVNCIQESVEEIKQIKGPIKFVSDLYPGFWENNVSDDTYRYHFHLSFSRNELPDFCDDLEYGVYGCGTVTYDAIQIAVYLGFKEIYLLGVDFSFSKDYKDKSNHFVENYYNKNSKTTVVTENEQLKAYQKAKQYAETHGIKIYNATRGGKLEVFERVDFDSLFEKGEQD